MTQKKLSTIPYVKETEEAEIELQEELLPAMIFDADNVSQEVPFHYNAVKILLDGTMQADLTWHQAKVAADVYRKRGLKIFWEMDLGLFSRLKNPIGCQTQFLSLCLSLEHFCNTLWQDYKKETVGLCLYRGSADFSREFQWDEEQLTNFQEWIKDSFKDVNTFKKETGIETTSFECLSLELLSSTPQGCGLIALFCRDAVSEYVDLLASRLPDSLNCVLMLDCNQVEDPLLQAQLTIRDRYSNIQLAIREMKSSFWKLVPRHVNASWTARIDDSIIGKEKLPSVEEKTVSPAIGICLPEASCRKPSCYYGLKEAFEKLVKLKMAFRIVSESWLTSEWDGLDYLIVSSQGLGAQGYRKLRGFCAAGGTVITLGPSLDLQNTLSFEEWLNKPLSHLATYEGISGF